MSEYVSEYLGEENFGHQIQMRDWSRLLMMISLAILEV